MDINLNNKVSVQLTNKGKQIFFAYANIYLHDITKCKYLGYDIETNILNIELWNIMSIFGEYMHIGCEVPFINNIISYETNNNN